MAPLRGAWAGPVAVRWSSASRPRGGERADGPGPPVTAYRTSTRIKLGLILAAVAIGVASLWFTQRLADRLEAQDEQAVELWARAIEFQYRVASATPGPAPWDELGALAREAGRPDLGDAVDALRDAPAADGLDFVFSQIIEPNRFSIPAVITDTAMTAAAIARNVDPDADPHAALLNPSRTRSPT